MEIFKQTPLKEASFFHRLLKKEPTENAIIEVNNLLSNNESDITKVSIDDINKISEKYKTNLERNFEPNRIALFAIYLRHSLSDNKLDETKIQYLYHLRNILMLNPIVVEQSIKNETENIYNEQVKIAVKDGDLKEDEKERLKKLKSDLKISDDVAQEIYSKNAGEIINNFMNGVASRERFSPYEEKQMNEIIRNLNIDYIIDEKSKSILERYKLYWQIENADLPEITPTINIQKSEKLHFSSHINWLEQRKVAPKRRTYAGPTARVKLAKGVYYRVGSFKVNNVSKDEWKTIDSGQVYLTNKRLIFMGNKGNKTIRINTILDIAPYSNGVDIQKDAGKSPFLEFSNNIDVFSMILARLMSEQ